MQKTPTESTKLHEFPTKNHPNIIGHALDKGAKVNESGASNKWSKLSMAHPFDPPLFTVQGSFNHPFWQRAGTNGSWIKDIKIKCGPSASCLNDEVFSRCYCFVWRGFHSLVMCWSRSWEAWKARRVARSYATNTFFFWKKYGIHILQLDHSMIHSGPGWKEPQVETQQYFCLYLSCYTRNTLKKVEQKKLSIKLINKLSYVISSWCEWY